ncbi:MAG: hypothetical protein ABIO46_11385 [Chitinophagales bacterium]
MKIIAIISSLVIMLFYAAGYFIVFSISQQHVKTEMKKLIRNGKFTDHYETLSFTEQQFEKLKIDDHEFLYDGKMYDIVKIVAEGASLTITCILDEKEKELIGKLGNYLYKNQSSHENAGNSSGSLLKFLDTVFIGVPGSTVTAGQSAILSSFYRLYFYQCPLSAVINPPPESVVS